jgi:4-hydroxyphenylacetate 3-monooxygenase
MTKTGSQHAESLKDGRQVFINGQAVANVAEHPAFRGTLRTIGGLFDFAARPENVDLMTFEPSDASGRRANRIWQLPRSYQDLVQRRLALEAWAELHAGFLGRAPDHVASCLSGMVMGLDVFEAYDAARAGALAHYYRYARDNDLYLTYVIINPQADRSKGPSEQRDRFLTAGVVDEDSDGVTIRGGKMLATGGVFANEVFVTCIHPSARARRPMRSPLPSP